MLDFVLLATIGLVGALVAAAVLWLATRGAPRPWRRGACWSWAIGAGVLAASGAAGQWPHWPPFEDRARFLTLLVPLVLLLETLAAFLHSRGMAWILRLGLTAIVAPILLHNSVYLADLDGPNSAEWTRLEAAIVLCGLAGLLALVWTMLGRLQARSSIQAVLWVLVLDALATAVTVMLSGYYGGGLLGLGLAGSLAGATLASYFVQPRSQASDGLGMGVVGIFSVVLVGRFFGNLSTALAACLLLAPLLAWIVELPKLRKIPPAWRTAGRLICVAIPLTFVVIVAYEKFIAASTARSRTSRPGAVRDLMEE